jgi:hypothetical protein
MTKTLGAGRAPVALTQYFAVRAAISNAGRDD